MIGVLGFVSWDIVSDIKSEIKSEIEAKRVEVTERVTETRIIAKRANEIIQWVEKQLDEFEPQAKNLNDAIQKIKTLNITSQDLTADYSKEIQSLVSNVDSLSQRFVALAKQFEQLNILASGNGVGIGAETPQSPQQRLAAIQPVISDSEKAEQRLVQARKKTTVFFQFAGGRREQAEALSAALITDGYIVPSEDREGGAAAKHEVRYFHNDAKATAQRLANDTTHALRTSGYTAGNVPDVTVNSFAAYPGKKPRLGVLELWLEIPPR